MENVVVHPLVLLSVVDHFNRSVRSVFKFRLIINIGLQSVLKCDAAARLRLAMLSQSAVS